MECDLEYCPAVSLMFGSCGSGTKLKGNTTPVPMKFIIQLTVGEQKKTNEKFTDK